MKEFKVVLHSNGYGFSVVSEQEFRVLTMVSLLLCLLPFCLLVVSPLLKLFLVRDLSWFFCTYGLLEFAPVSNFLSFLVQNTYKRDRIGPGHVFQSNHDCPLTLCTYPWFHQLQQGGKSHMIRTGLRTVCSSKAAGGGIELGTVLMCLLQICLWKY